MDNLACSFAASITCPTIGVAPAQSIKASTSAFFIPNGLDTYPKCPSKNPFKSPFFGEKGVPPIFFAKSKRCSFISTTTGSLQPTASTAFSVQRPIVPAPKITTFSCGFTLIQFFPCVPTANGSMTTASSNDTSSDN